ncbi:MAG: ATP-binding protein [Clostridium argentinense]|uniref:ATP-binding protein n=1 Tax=Clostridium faecium TaxID=2762223 RepID=A0ABR8YX27_9CLOT|nr:MULTISPECIES: ATP-binding protein [Clostridium]MBD8048842.1 ATP-binding protein [Clostridium faecium]MBS5824831.1 ATP-binding protein [Clostridium argentinense]MDU1349218.1 ATP-binding protein [Clostridium argentinense]
MIKQHHSEIMKIYENIRKSEENALKLRKEEIEQKLPMVIEIEDEIKKLSLKLSLAAIKSMNNKEDYMNSIKEKIIDLRMKKGELLASNGYDVNYLTLKYRCNKCKDTGYVYVDKCSCYKQYLVQLYYNNSDLKHLLDKNNFNNFNINYFSNKLNDNEKISSRANMERNYEKSMEFIENFKNNDDNLLFYGNSGTGKTFLSHCIAKELIERGYFVVYKTSDDLISALKEIKFNNNSNMEDCLINCDLLIIDDLGTEQISDFSKKELFNLLNTKLLRQKKMLISTNYALSELSNIYSERFTSRLFGNFLLFKFFGSDIRILKKI